MTARKEKAPEALETVSIRLPPRRVRFFEAKAAEANTYRGTYIADLLLGEEPVSWPSVAALGYVIAIHDAVMASRTITAEQLDELRSILRELAGIAREEVVR